MTATPKMPLIQLKTSATIPRAVNPPGRGDGGEGWPARSSRSTVFPAALPAVGMLSAAQASRWSWGIVTDFWSSSGASMKVAASPETTCHSVGSCQYISRKERKRGGLGGVGVWFYLCGSGRARRRDCPP